MNRTFTISLAMTLLAFCMTESAGAQATYTYTGEPFSYVGTGPDVTNISGFFTVPTALAPNTSYAFNPNGVSDYSFTDGRFVDNLANIANSDAFNPGNVPLSEPSIDVETDSSGNITSWYLNIVGPNAYFNSWESAYYNSLYAQGLQDGTQADPSGPYDAYNFNSPGTWTVSVVPEPASVSLLGIATFSLLARRRARGTAH